MAEEQVRHTGLGGAARNAFRGLLKGRLITRRLPADLGSARVRVSPESQLKYLLPGDTALDPMLLRLAREFVKSGDLVWDVGANVGVFAFAAASKGAHVIAVEPDPVMSRAILDARPLNPKLRVDLLTAAVSDEFGVAELSISSNGRASNTLAAFVGDRPAYGDVQETILVPTVTLDSLLSRGTPALIKIDVEGAEMAVLKGGAKVLKDIRPILQVEVAYSRRDELTVLMTKAGYRLHDTVEWMKPLDRATENVICIPAESALAGA